MTESNRNTSNPYDEKRKRCSCGEIGTIVVKGPNVFCGYRRMPEKTTSEFTGDGFFVPEDLGRVDEDGYIQIVG